MRIANAPAPVPDPPNYSSCAAKLKAEASQSIAPSAVKSELELKHSCRQRYEELFTSGLSAAIHTEWVAGEAAELGVSVSAPVLQQRFDAAKKALGVAKFEAYRKTSGETIADMMREFNFDIVTNKIFEHIHNETPTVTNADVARFYDTHRQHYAIPSGRNVRIVRTATNGSALKAMQELRSGMSFGSVAKELSAIGQPIGAVNGEVKDLKPGVFEEKNLNDAIFTAKLHQIYGPLELTASHKTIARETNTGFFIFEVTGIVPGRRTPLSRVKNGLAEELRSARKAHTVEAFILAYRHKWIARTNCFPGYVVNRCRQFGRSLANAAIDPYTL